jgi:hypothetical protein
MDQYPLFLNNGVPTSTALSGSSAFVAYNGAACTTMGTLTTPASFTTFPNSPTLSIIPTVSGTYKVYCAGTVYTNTGASCATRIFNTSGSATLIAESQGVGDLDLTASTGNTFMQSTYTLTAAYTFDIQGKYVSSSGNVLLDGTVNQFYIFAEGIGLTPLPAVGQYVSAYFGSSSSWASNSTTFADPTNSGGNTLTVRTNAGISLTAAASNLPGITWTPPSNSAVYFVTAVVMVGPPSLNNALDLLLTDGTINVCTAGVDGINNSADVEVVTFMGVYAPATSSATTLKIQLGGSGSGSITSGSPEVNSIEWTVLRIV